MITRVKIGIFPILIAYWSGFWIFKQNRDNPDEIGMVGQSENVTNRSTASKHGMYVCTLKICATTIPLRYVNAITIFSSPSFTACFAILCVINVCFCFLKVWKRVFFRLNFIFVKNVFHPNLFLFSRYQSLFTNLNNKQLTCLI